MKKVENFDAYSEYRYKKKPQKRAKKGKFLAIFFVIFCLIVIIFFSISFSNFLLVGKVVNINSNVSQIEKTLFCLSLSSHQNKDDALISSKNQQNQGGAGFVYQTNGAFKVVSSIYSSKKDCEKVVSNLNNSNYSCEIIPLNLPQINLKLNLNSSQTKILNESLNLFYKNYQTLYNLSVEFDKQNIDEIKLKSSVKNLQDENAKVCEKYSKNFQQSSFISVLYVKIYLNKINSYLENILCAEENIYLSSATKLAYCEIILDYQNLCNEIL